MKRILLFLLLLISIGIQAQAADVVAYECKFGPKYNSQSLSSYVNSWTVTNEGFTWDLVNWNNNNNSWTYVKAGRKDYASTATITTSKPMPEPITKVVVTIDDITATNVNSITLQTADNADFTSADTYDIVDKAQGDQTVTIKTPTANLYYRLTFDCKKGSNGLVQVSSIKYYKTDSDPRTPVTLSFPDGSYTANLGQNFESPTLKVEPTGAKSLVKYSSSNTAVATVNEVTGEVGLVKAGTTTITASISGSTVYRDDKASYDLIVKDPNDIYTEITPQFFNYTSGSYEAKEMSDKFEVKYSAVYYGSTSNMQFNTSNANGKGSGVNVITTNSDYIITSIDIEMTEPNNTNGLNVYKSDKAFSALKKTTAPTLTGATKINSSLITQSTSVEINAPAFAVVPNSTGAINVQKITVHYSYKTAPKPVMPVVSIGSETLEYNKTKTVASGTELNIVSEYADEVIGTKDGSPISLTHSSPSATYYTYTITEGGEYEFYGKNESGESDHFRYTFEIGETDENMPPVGSNFRQLLNGSSFSEGYYVIARVEENGAYAMSTKSGSTTNMPATSNITATKIDNNKDKVFDVVTTIGDDVLILYLEQNDEGQQALRTVNYGDGFLSSQRYLWADETSTTLKVVEEFTPVYLSITNQNNTNIKFTNKEEDNRTIGFTNSNNNSYLNYAVKGLAVELCQFTTAQLFNPEFADMEIRIGDEPAVIFLDKKDAPEISYSVKTGGKTIISLNDDNSINALKAGEATVVAVWDEVPDQWFAGKAEFNVTVLPKKIEDPEGVIKFRHKTIRGKKDVGVVGQAAWYSGDGEVTYTSSNDAEVHVDPKTGMIRPDDIKNAQVYTEDNPVTYTITASVGETKLHVAASDTYTIIIEAPEERPLAKSEATFIFNDGKNKYEMFEFNAANTSGEGSLQEFYESSFPNDKVPEHEAVSEIIEGPVSLNLEGKYRYFKAGQAAPFTYQLRSNKGSSLTFSVEEGSIMSVKFTGNKANGTNLKASINGTWTESNTKWEANDKTVTEITFSNPNDNGTTVQIETITVTVLAPDASDERETADLNFEDADRIINTFVGKSEPITGLNYSIPFEYIQFDIDEIDEEEDDVVNYQIDRDDEKESVNVTVFDPGVYTFRAYVDSDENPEYYAGMAILRLNVFPHLDVLPEDESALADDARTEAAALTLVHPTIDEEGYQNVSINLPNIKHHLEGEDGMRFSTLSVVGIKANQSSKKTDDEDSKLAMEEILDPEGETYVFKNDGYLKYTLRYADTEDFQKEIKTHVVIMPQTLPYESIESSNIGGKDAIYTLTPSQNAKLQYYAFVTGDRPEEIATVAELGDDEGDFEWSTYSSAEPFTVTLPDDVPVGQYYVVYYRSMKDLADIVDDEVVPDNSELTSDYAVVAIKNDAFVPVNWANVIDGDVVDNIHGSTHRINAEYTLTSLDADIAHSSLHVKVEKASPVATIANDGETSYTDAVEGTDYSLVKDDETGVKVSLLKAGDYLLTPQAADGEDLTVEEKPITAQVGKLILAVAVGKVNDPWSNDKNTITFQFTGSSGDDASSANLQDNELTLTVNPTFNNTVEQPSAMPSEGWNQAVWNEMIDLQKDNYKVDGYYYSDFEKSASIDNSFKEITASIQFPCSGTYQVNLTTTDEDIEIENGTVSATIYPTSKNTFNTLAGGVANTFSINWIHAKGDEIPYYKLPNGDLYMQSTLDKATWYIPGVYMLDAVYYKVSEASNSGSGEAGGIEPNRLAKRMAAPDGYTQSTDNTLNISSLEGYNGTYQLNLVLSKNGAQTPVDNSGNSEVQYLITVTTTVPTGVEGVGADEEEVEWYDLNGYRVNPERLDKGIYIRVQGDKATKVIL